jgi:hypothetical protein
MLLVEAASPVHQTHASNQSSEALLKKANDSVGQLHLDPHQTNCEKENLG